MIRSARRVRRPARHRRGGAAGHRGPQDRHALTGGLFELLGTRWSRGGRPITVDDVELELSHVAAVLEALDQVRADGARWRAGPGARWLLPRAAALAELSSPETAPTQPHHARGRQLP